MMNNLLVKFRKMAIKIKKVAIVITLKEVSATVTDRREEFGIYFHGASEAEHSRFTEVNFKALSKKNKIFHTKTAIYFFLNKGCPFHLGGFLLPDKIKHYFINLCCKVFWGLHNAGDEYKFGEG